MLLSLLVYIHVVGLLVHDVLTTRSCSDNIIPPGLDPVVRDVRDSSTQKQINNVWLLAFAFEIEFDLGFCSTGAVIDVLARYIFRGKILPKSQN